MKQILNSIYKILVFFVNKLLYFLKHIFAKIVSNKKLAVISVVSILVVIILVSFIIRRLVFKKAKDEKSQIVKVKVEKIKKENKSISYPVMGTIKGTVETELRFEIEGVIQKYNYKEGDRIPKDATIAYLDIKDAMAKLQYAKNKYESEKAAYFSAQQRLKVYEDLFKLKAISESKIIEVRYEVESIKQRMATAMAELDLAQSNLQKTNLKAPYAGVLAEIYIHAGEFVTPNDVVAKFISIQDVYCEVEVPEKDVLQLKTGLNATLTCDAYPNTKFDGVVSEIAPIVKEKTRTVVVKIRIPNPQGLLRSGMFARGEIKIQEIQDAIAVLKDSVI
ncbi:MAG: efflux RND transporter periplasmic adaptor subunit, partial [Endomicrobia bacterium]|nr:efflux RND transporter periplasmic adaptor subunit [Endomicrobiia bacterium]